MPSGRTRIAFTGAVLMLLLAGCGAPSADVARPSTSATPHASPVAAATPSVRVPLACGDLADAAELDASAGSALTTVDPSIAAPADLESTAATQFGALDCAWSTRPLAIDLPVPVVTITVVPDVGAQRWAEFVSARGDDAARGGDYGAESFVACAPTRFDGSTCVLDNLVGEYWLRVLVSTPDLSASLASTAAVFERATDAVRAIAEPAAPRWVSEHSDASRLDSATVSAAIAASGRFEPQQQTVTPQFGTTWLSMAETDATSTLYSGTGAADGAPVEFELQVLPSGAWAFAGLGRAGGDGVPVDGLGDAAAAYPSPDGTAVIFAMGDDLVLLDVFGSPSADGTDTARAVATAEDVAALFG